MAGKKHEYYDRKGRKRHGLIGKTISRVTGDLASALDARRNYRSAKKIGKRIAKGKKY